MAYDHTCPFYNARMHTLILRHQVEQEVRLEHTRYHVTITIISFRIAIRAKGGEVFGATLRKCQFPNVSRTDDTMSFGS